jgi:hypothetical protein
VTSTLTFLLGLYGPVLTIDQLAKTLSRKPGGLRSALQDSDKAWVKSLNARKTRIGRRVYFPTDAVAALLDGEKELERYKL